MSRISYNNLSQTIKMALSNNSLPKWLEEYKPVHDLLDDNDVAAIERIYRYTLRNAMLDDAEFINKLLNSDQDQVRDLIRSYKMSPEDQMRVTQMVEKEIDAYLIRKEEKRDEKTASRIFRQKLYENLMDLLDENNLSPRQLVLRLNEDCNLKINQSQFSKMFSPNNSVIQEPSIQILSAIADYFNVPVDRLLNGTRPDGKRSDGTHPDGKRPDGKQPKDVDHLTYNDFLRLLNELESRNYISFKRHEDQLLTTTGDPGDVEVSIHIHVNTDGSGGDDGTIAHYLSMYTSLKKHFPDTPEGRRMVNEMNEMMLKTVGDIPLFPDLK